MDERGLWTRWSPIPLPPSPLCCSALLSEATPRVGSWLDGRALLCALAADSVHFTAVVHEQRQCARARESQRSGQEAWERVAAIGPQPCRRLRDQGAAPANTETAGAPSCPWGTRQSSRCTALQPSRCYVPATLTTFLMLSTSAAPAHDPRCLPALSSHNPITVVRPRRACVG